MRILTAILLLISVQAFANKQEGVVVNILPDKLILSNTCAARADLESQEFSIIYACKDSQDRRYFYNFRLNNIDLVADFKKSSTEVVVNKTHFKPYTLVELTAKNADNKPIKFVSYCTKALCLDLVSDNEFEASVQAAITAQLQG